MDRLQAEIIQDAARLNKLLDLCGYVQDSSFKTVSLEQDDATGDQIIRIGKRWWCAKGWRAVIDLAISEGRQS